MVRILSRLCSNTDICFTEVIESKRAMVESFDITTQLTKTAMGLKAVPALQQEMKGRDVSPIGRLIRPVRRQEIAERNGQNGRPLWITLGRNAFSLIGMSGLSTHSHIPCSSGH